MLVSPRIIFLTFISVLFCYPSEAFLKQILGATLMGNVRSAISSLKCVEYGSNFTSFSLFTRSRHDNPSTLIPNNWNNLQKSNFDSSFPTKVIVHGFLDNIHLSEWIMDMKSALLREGHYNVIVVDWSCGNGFPYFQAVKNSRVAATLLGDLILFLIDAGKAHPADFHIIGHSLGSQIAGHVGRRVPNLGRISALDPAGPLFYNAPPEGRLDPSDASFVDVIHTDGGRALLEGLGLFSSVGHVDFYPNGGHTQPGCHSSPFDVLPRVGWQRVARYYLSCDHFRSVYFYISSIEQKDSSCQFAGVKCRDWETFSEGQCVQCDANNCAVMGFYSGKSSAKKLRDVANVYYMKTSDDEPYCVFQYRVVLETGESSSRYVSNKNADVVIYIEIKTDSGRSLRLKLAERNESLWPGKKYTYLSTSQFPIGQVKSAALWWGSEHKPRPQSRHSKVKIGLSAKRLEITPITAQSSKRLSKVGDTQSEKVILCVKEERVLAKDELMVLSLNC